MVRSKDLKGSSCHGNWWTNVRLRDTILATQAFSKCTQAIAQQREICLAALQIRVFFLKPIRQIHVFSTNDKWQINNIRKTLRNVFSTEIFRRFNFEEKDYDMHEYLITIITFCHCKLYKKARDETRSIYAWRNSGLKNSQETRHREGKKPPETVVSENYCYRTLRIKYLQEVNFKLLKGTLILIKKSLLHFYPIFLRKIVINCKIT